MKSRFLKIEYRGVHSTHNDIIINVDQIISINTFTGVVVLSSADEFQLTKDSYHELLAIIEEDKK